MSISNILEGIKVNKNKDLFIVTLSEDIEIPFILPSYKFAQQMASVLQTVEEPYFEYLVYKYIFEYCVADKFIAKGNDSLPAGIVETIAKLVLYLSGSDSSYQDQIKELLPIYREYADKDIVVIKRTICSVFNAYKFSDLDNLNFQDLILLFVNAEKVLLENKSITKPFMFVEQKEKQSHSLSKQISQDMQEYQSFDREAPPQKNRYNIEEITKRREAEFYRRQRMRG